MILWILQGTVPPSIDTSDWYEIKIYTRSFVPLNVCHIDLGVCVSRIQDIVIARYEEIHDGASVFSVIHSPFPTFRSHRSSFWGFANSLALYCVRQPKVLFPRQTHRIQYIIQFLTKWLSNNWPQGAWIRQSDMSSRGVPLAQRSIPRFFSCIYLIQDFLLIRI